MAKPAGIKWSATTRAKLHGFKAKHAKDPPDAHAVLTIAEAWNALRAFDDGKAIVVAKGALKAPIERVQKEAAAKVPPKLDRAIELHRAAYYLTRGDGSRQWADWDDWAAERALVGFWTAAGGIAATIELLLGKGTFWVSAGPGWADGAATMSLTYEGSRSSGVAASIEDVPYSFRPVEVGGATDTTIYGLWSALRCRVGGLGDAELAHANADAHAARKALPKDDFWGRAAISFAFSRDSTHAVETLAHWQASNKTTAAACLLLVASPDVASAQPIVKQCHEDYLGHNLAFDLVESFGADAAPLLDRAIKDLAKAKGTGEGYRKRRMRPVEAALKLLR
jgi:hypothetical protein